MWFTMRFASRTWPVLGEVLDQAFQGKARKQSAMVRQARVSLLALLWLMGVLPCRLFAQAVPTKTSPEKVVIDTDIGDDIDDAFAIALALRSPELEILGVSTTFGDTETR